MCLRIFVSIPYLLGYTCSLRVFNVSILSRVWVWTCDDVYAVPHMVVPCWKWAAYCFHGSVNIGIITWWHTVGMCILICILYPMLAPMSMYLYKCNVYTHMHASLPLHALCIYIYTYISTGAHHYLYLHTSIHPHPHCVCELLLLRHAVRDSHLWSSHTVNDESFQ